MLAKNVIRVLLWLSTNRLFLKNRFLMTYTIFVRIKEESLSKIYSDRSKFPELFQFFGIRAREKLDASGFLFVFFKPRGDRTREKNFFREIEEIEKLGLLVSISDIDDNTEKPLNEKVSDNLLYYIEDVTLIK